MIVMIVTQVLHLEAFNSSLFLYKNPSIVPLYFPLLKASTMFFNPRHQK